MLFSNSLICFCPLIVRKHVEYLLIPIGLCLGDSCLSQTNSEPLNWDGPLVTGIMTILSSLKVIWTPCNLNSYNCGELCGCLLRYVCSEWVKPCCATYCMSCRLETEIRCLCANAKPKRLRSTAQFLHLILASLFSTVAVRKGFCVIHQLL